MTTASGAVPGRTRPDRDRSPARAGQALLVVLAAFAAVPAVVSTVLRLFPPTDDATALVASFIPYGLVAYIATLILLLVALARARRRVILAVVTVLVLALTTVNLGWLAPMFIPDDRPATTPAFTVLSLNLYDGQADPAGIVAQAEQADVVILIETTPVALHALNRLGWDERFRYAVGDVDGQISDTTIYSRLPLGASALIGPTSFQQWLTTVEAPGIGAVRLIAAHPCNPYCGSNRWDSEHAALRAVIRPHLGEPMIVSGDLNAVDDHGPMQLLRTDGLRSATDLTGAGWQPTYPANRAFPPLLPIDHILLSRRLTATSIKTFRVPGTDHLGLLATIAGTG